MRSLRDPQDRRSRVFCEGVAPATHIFIRAKPHIPNVAKHPKRRMGRYLRGKVEQRLDLGTLSANTLISVDLAGTVQERALATSIVSIWALADFTNAIGDGPIVVGVAHSDYTDSEIEAFLENAGSWTEGNKVSQEIARRKVRIVGTFLSSVADSAGIAVLNDGKPIKTKLNWILNIGQTLSVWAYNSGDSALATTDPDLTVIGHVNLFPK